MKYEIWLGNHYSYFDKGIAHHKDGSTSKLEMFVHVSTYGCDTVLVSDEKSPCNFSFPLRYYIKNGAIEFYSVSKDTPCVTFHNGSDNDIRIDKYGVLKSGESISISLH